MKTIAILLFIGLTFKSAAQLPADSWLYGTWVKQGYEFQGSFYPVNSWNTEKLVLSEDYSLQRTVGEVAGHEVSSSVHEGKWSYDAAYKKLNFFSDREQFSAQGKVILFDQEYELDFTSPNYFTVEEKKGNYIVTARFQREGTTQTFKESVAQEEERLADLALRYDPNSRVFYMVNSFNRAKRKPMYFDDERFDFSHTVYGKDKDIKLRETDFTGTIVDFTDSTIVVNVDHETISTTYSNGLETTVTNSYYFHEDGYARQEFKLKDLDDSYYVDLKFGSIAPITFSLSALTALVVAPLISINYKTGDFDKDRYYKTAGIGLIGVGASIPLAIIFNTSKRVRFIQPGAQANKKSWYLQKAPR